MTDAWAEPQQDFVLDSEGYNANDLKSAATVDKEGWYHWEIEDVKFELETLNRQGHPRSPCIMFQLSVLHSVPGQSPAGTKLFHRIYVGGKGGGAASEGAMKGCFRWGLNLGILKSVPDGDREKIVDAMTGKTQISSNTWLKAKGMQCVSKVQAEKNDRDQMEYRIPFGNVFLVDDDRVKDVPKNLQALAAIGKAPGQQPPPPPAAPPAAPAPNTPPPSTPPAAATGDWSDL